MLDHILYHKKESKSQRDFFNRICYFPLSEVIKKIKRNMAQKIILFGKFGRTAEKMPPVGLKSLCIPGHSSRAMLYYITS